MYVNQGSNKADFFNAHPCEISQGSQGLQGSQDSRGPWLSLDVNFISPYFVGFKMVNRSFT